MYKYGMTQWVAGGEDLELSFKRLAKYGYDAIEYAAEPYSLNRNYAHTLMEKYSIGCLSMCGIFDETRDLTLPPEAAESALRYLHDSIDMSAEMGATVLIVVPSPVGRVQPPVGVEMNQLWENAVLNLRCAAPYAEEHGIALAIEPINRYETYLVNSVAQACRMADDVNHRSVGVMADAFHMNIEESSPGAAIRFAGSRLKHIHIADSTRGPAGTGHVDFSEALHAMMDIDYDGAVVMEFMRKAANPYDALDGAAHTEIMDEYARISIDTMRALETAIRSARV